ncbi:universal stress protein [Hydrogenibacillus sp. N12]|uniref:universal stress protein n=1 Tax=Hydrogenibacillus sp. N12 TaxID=2866627 RepID=UPI001C7CA884|nr:universal stress protein [Hydrogenibacillus sp. N12]QZA33762.1 universal stress protein [Hydrogenibacillus sp. N12]
MILGNLYPLLLGILHPMLTEGVFAQMTGMISGAEYREMMLKRGEAVLAKAKEQADREGVSLSVELLQGDPARAIADYVEAKGVDLVILGRRGLNALQELFLGSVSHRVLQTVKANVLIAR